MLISLERWTTWFALRWLVHARVLAGEQHELDFERMHRGLWHAEDERTGAYDGIGAAGGGTRDRWLAAAWFSPGLDADATSLSLRFTSPRADRPDRVAFSLR